MRINTKMTLRKHPEQLGISLLELIVFILIVGLASMVLLKVYTYSVMHNSDSLDEVRAFESAQSKLDEVLALKYDASTPTGGIPACNGTNPLGIACDNTPDGDMNDIDDYHNVTDAPYTGYSRKVTVTTASDEKLISVAVTTPSGKVITLAAYRANF